MRSQIIQIIWDYCVPPPSLPSYHSHALVPRPMPSSPTPPSNTHNGGCDNFVRRRERRSVSVRHLHESCANHSSATAHSSPLRVYKPPVTRLRQHRVSQLGALDDDVLEVVHLLGLGLVVAWHKVLKESVERGGKAIYLGRDGRAGCWKRCPLAAGGVQQKGREDAPLVQGDGCH